MKNRNIIKKLKADGLILHQFKHPTKQGKITVYIPKKISLLELYGTFSGKLDGIGGKLCNTQ